MPALKHLLDMSGVELMCLLVSTGYKGENDDWNIMPPIFHYIRPTGDAAAAVQWLLQEDELMLLRLLLLHYYL